MARRKKKTTTKFKYKKELYGIVLIVVAILGLGKYGMFGNLVMSISYFLTGSLYILLLASFILIGLYIIIKHELPDFFSLKMTGIYLMVVGCLVFLHKDYVILTTGAELDIFRTTTEQLFRVFDSITNPAVGSSLVMSGGIIGCFFTILFNMLFSYIGMQIVAGLVILIGITMFTGFSLISFIKENINNKEKTPKNIKETKKEVIINNSENDEVVSEVKDKKNHIKISSIDELNSLNNNEEAKSVPESTEIVEKEKSIINSNYKLPTSDILDKVKKDKKTMNQAEIETNIVAVEQVLKDFNIDGKVVEVHIGPAVTQYELEIKSGTKVSKIVSLNKEISLELAKKDVRIEAPIPGKRTVGIEVPNDSVAAVSFREIFDKIPADKKSSKLLVPLGKNIMGNVIWCEIDKTPHLLVAGATGSGKSVCINGIISTILMRARPDEVKMVMVDPKKVELSGYNGIPHLMCPVVTDPKKASVALSKIVGEMERRYEVFESTRTKNITSYNELIDKNNLKLSDDDKQKRMPYIVVIVDELADLMMVASKDVEASIMRITQMARAAGIHLIIATQRPSTDVITGVVKANIPSRISFSVSSGIDSRTILNQTGAEKLLGKGDMLFFPTGVNSPQRVQGAYISDDEIKRIIDFTVKQQKAEFDEKLMNLDTESTTKSASQIEDQNQVEDYDDPLYNEIVEFVIQTQKASASLLQRRFKLGYNRAARIIDLLEERGIIGGVNGSKPREVLVQLEENID